MREARAAEAPAIAGLVLRAYAQYEQVVPPEMWAAYRAELADVGPRMVAPATPWVVEGPGGALAGCVTYYADAADDPHGLPAGWAAFRLLATDPDLRGRGVGRALVEHCIDAARRGGAPALGLHTAAFMHSAVRLYESLGFRRCPEHDFVAADLYGDERSPRLLGEAYCLLLA